MKKLVILVIAFAFLAAIPVIAQDKDTIPNITQSKWEYKIADLYNKANAEVNEMTLSQAKKILGSLPGQKINTEDDLTYEMIQNLLFHKIEEKLTELGNESWELVETIKGQIWIFKRRVVDIEQKKNIKN